MTDLSLADWSGLLRGLRLILPEGIADVTEEGSQVVVEVATDPVDGGSQAAFGVLSGGYS